MEFYYVNNYLIIPTDIYKKLSRFQLDGDYVYFSEINFKYSVQQYLIPCEKMGCVNMLNIDNVLEFLSIEMVEHKGNHFKYSCKSDSNHIPHH